MPDGYFEHLSHLRGKKRKIGAGESVPNSALTGNGGPVSVAVHGSENKAPRLTNGEANGHGADRNPENRVDIRYVVLFFILGFIQLLTLNAVCTTSPRSRRAT